MCQSHTGRLTGRWFLPKPAFGLNTNDDDDDYLSNNLLDSTNHIESRNTCLQSRITQIVKLSGFNFLYSVVRTESVKPCCTMPLNSYKARLDVSLFLDNIHFFREAARRKSIDHSHYFPLLQNAKPTHTSGIKFNSPWPIQHYFLSGKGYYSAEGNVFSNNAWIPW